MRNLAEHNHVHMYVHVHVCFRVIGWMSRLSMADFLAVDSIAVLPITLAVGVLPNDYPLCQPALRTYGLRWWLVCINIMNNYIFVFFISLLLYCTEETCFSHTIVWSAPPNAENISHQQLHVTWVLRPIRVEFSCLWCLIHIWFILPASRCSRACATTYS